MTVRTLQKWHGAGNDFLVEVSVEGTAIWWTRDRIRAVCERTTGVGADGLALATLGSPVMMVLYNADGSTAEMSGNGVRCLAAAVRRTTNADWTTLDVLTESGLRTVTLVMDGSSGYGSVDMGRVSFVEPLKGSLGVANVGNPHVVVRDDHSWSDTLREGMAEQWARQMGGANVEFVRVIDRGRLELRVIERGVGWTMACGTGSVAAVAVFQREGLVDSDVLVDNPGGQLRVQLSDHTAALSGPVQFVADVEWLDA